MTAGPRELESLLVDSSQPPAEQIARIASARQDIAGDPALAADLDRSELAFLLEQAHRPAAPPEVTAAAEASRRSALAWRLRALERADATDPAVLFDLAELRAECLWKDLSVEAVAAARLRDARIGSVRVDESLLEEARERWAALSTEAEDLDLRHRVQVLRETGSLLEALAGRGHGRELRRLARRLERTANDRALQVRLEDVLGGRGAMLLETTSFLLLMVVMVLLLVEGVVLDPAVHGGWIRTLAYVDGGICLFFIAEFGFKLVLAPARSSWFLRNVLTDLLPAVPAALWLLPAGDVMSGQENAAAVRILRLLRLTWAARYVQALRPALRLWRLLLFLIRGMDGVVRRFSPALNRNFVFFERTGEPRREGDGERTRRRLAFQALRREHVLLADLPREARWPLLQRRAAALEQRLAAAAPVATGPRTPPAGSTRDIPVEEAIEFLYGLHPEELGQWLPRRDLLALDRVVRVIDAPVVRSLPLVRRLRLDAPAETAEERVAGLAARVAAWLEQWRARLLYVADLHGIVTGPQILDRVATAMVKASQRPAVRLLMFGGLFTVVRLLVGENAALGRILERFVATPLVVLGAVCLVFLAVGRWLKSLAGEAADTFKLTSEAHFLSLMHLVKRRREEQDLDYLARRLFRWEMEHDEARRVLRGQVREVRLGDHVAGDAGPEALREDLHRVALLYLHFLDGAILHASDIKSTEQLLANLSMENIRYGHLGFRRRDRKRLRRLSLEDGSLLGGPYLWFRFITESVAVETAKRVTEYNRHCLTREQRERAGEEERAAMARWLARRRGERTGRTLDKLPPPGGGPLYRTTEFNALDFLVADPDRDRHLEDLFGAEVVELLCHDRRGMVREIFGMRPLHEMPRSRRSFNAYRFYMHRLSVGRVFLMPFYLLWAACRSLGMVAGKTRQIVREILRPQSARRHRVSGRAPFAVALRKIHRMKAPGLLEAMHTRVRFDPVYCGAPPTWSESAPFDAVPELERDMDFLDMKEREREELRAEAAANRRRVEELQGLAYGLGDLGGGEEDALDRRLGERAVTIAYMTDRDGLRTMLRLEGWAEEVIPHMEDPRTRVAGLWVGSLLAWLLRLGRRHPVDRWLDGPLAGRRVSRRGRRNLKRAWRKRRDGVRENVAAWLRLPSGRAPMEEARERARAAFRDRGAVSRELTALRAVQTLSVLDVRNYRSLVFRLGGYAEDGEDPGLGEALP